MRTFLFLALWGSATLVFAGNQLPVDSDQPGDDGEVLQLLSAATHLSMEASDFQHEVKGETSYKRSQVPATRLANLSNRLMQAIEEGAECVQLRVLIESVKHRYGILRRGFESDHAIWRVARVGWSFHSLSDAHRVFKTVANSYLSSRECYQHPRDR